MSPDEINEYLATQFPHLESVLFVESVDECGIRVQLPLRRFLRPGGTSPVPRSCFWQIPQPTQPCSSGADSAHAVTSVASTLFVVLSREI